MKLVAQNLLLGISRGALAVGCIMALATPVIAQTAEQPSDTPADTQTTDANAIVVTGYRASLRTALNEKRNADGQIDAITAEDIADFPDSNLAESLQRIPGISIDRDNGEGRQISVRGLGGDFNRTRINNLEALSTAGSNDAGTSPNRSRAFDYNTFASELFSSIKIRKTPAAEIDEGSLGATIDLTTARPFDDSEGAFAIGTEGSYQKNSKEWSPRLSGLFSRKFLDGKMGFLVSGAYAESRNEIDQYSRALGAFDFLYRNSDFAGNEAPQRSGFAAPTGTNLGSAITNPEVIDLLTGSDPTAYANLYPGAPFNTPGRFDDSLVRIPALPSLEQQDNSYERLGLTAAYQWQISSRTRLSIDGLYSRFNNKSVRNQLSPVGLNRNNTNTTFNTAGTNLTPLAARNLYAGNCAPQAETDLLLPQDCGEELYGTTPAFATALDRNGNLVPSVLATGTIVPGASNPSTANIFSTNPFNLSPYDYYNNPNSVGYIPSNNRLAFRGELIGRPSVKVLESNVTNGLADYLVLQNVDFRSAQDTSEYTNKFRQVSFNLQHEFTDNFRGEVTYGQSRSELSQQGLLVEFNRMDSQGLFVYDERGGGDMPVLSFGFDAADPANWDTVKGFSGIRHFQRNNNNSYDGGKADFTWEVNPEIAFKTGFTLRKYEFSTDQFELNSDLLNPTLLEAGSSAAAVSRTIEFGQGLNLPDGTLTSFVVPDTQAFDELFELTCNCVNKWSDWRITDKRNRAASFGVTEKNVGGYFQLDFDTMLGDDRLRGNIGTRVMRTKVDSQGQTNAGRPILGENTYTDFLPSFNLAFEPVSDVVLRAGISKVIARPLLGNLSPSITALSIPNNGNQVGATVTIGNPKLSPFRSTNVDLSAEWYFAPGAILSLAAFYKDIANFPQTTFSDGPLSQFADAQTIEELQAQFANDAPRLAYLENPDAVFFARQFNDAPGGFVRGLEASFQMDLIFLPGLLKNLGVQVNGTYIESELNYILEPGNATVEPIFGKGPFLGVSPKALNATVYYETERFRIRFSGAYRAEYSRTYPIAGGTCAPGILTSPVPTDPNASVTYCNGPLINDFEFNRSTLNIDMASSFKVTDELSLSFEGLNLTNQTTDRYAYTGQEPVTNYASSGPIYRIGARVVF